MSRSHVVDPLLMLVAAVLVVLVPARPAVAAGGWVWPLPGPHEVSRGFDPPASRYGIGHRGADLPGSRGDPVLAAGAGVVSYAGLLAGRGVLVISHGELRTTYEPVAALVAVGERVSAGELVGTLEPGHAGCPAEACLHWGLKRGEDYLDPVALVERGPARLLPLGGPPDRALHAALREPPGGPSSPPRGALVAAHLGADAGSSLR